MSRLRKQVEDSESESSGEDSVDEINDAGSLSEEGDFSEIETGSESEDESSKVASSSVDSHPTEWIEFNKKIVSMRPLYKSAKVQFIHKLTRQIKMLRNRKGNPENVEKCRKKADRLVEEISYVNRLKRDIIPKFALLHSREEVEKIMNSGVGSMEYRVKAKVAAMPVISKVADEYHSTHPDWRETLFQLIQTAGKKMKNKRRKLRGKRNEKKRKPNDLPVQTKAKKSRVNQCLEEDSERFGAAKFPEPPPGLSSLADSELNSENEEDSDISDDDTEGSDDLGEAPDVKEEDIEGRSDDSREGRKTKSLPVPSVGVNNSRVKNLKTPSSENTRKNVTNKSAWRVTKTSSQPGVCPAEKIAVKSKDNVDPFFITSDNKEYKTIWKVEPADSFKNKNPKAPEFMFKGAKPFKELKKISKSDIEKHKKTNSKITKTKATAVAPESLHPSWQAKKKLNVVTAPFQGKKIVFDD